MIFRQFNVLLKETESLKAEIRTIDEAKNRHLLEREQIN